MFNRDGNLAGPGSSLVVGNAPVNVFTPGDGGDGIVVEFAEAEIPL